MPIQVETDAALFAMIHSLLDDQEPAQEFERRGGDRHSYSCQQLMAPYDGWALPKQADFRLVQCRDLSPSGFSFVSQKRPDFEHLVIALGAVPFSFFSAQVMHVKVTAQDSGKPYLVGCRFLHRLT